MPQFMDPKEYTGDASHELDQPFEAGVREAHVSIGRDKELWAGFVEPVALFLVSAKGMCQSGTHRHDPILAAFSLPDVYGQIHKVHVC